MDCSNCGRKLSSLFRNLRGDAMENKLNFKHVLLVAFTLMLVAGIAGALIVCLNLFTEPIIKDNDAKKEQQMLSEVYNEATFVAVQQNIDIIETVYEAKVNDALVGYVFKVSDKNAYGKISVLVGINLDGSTKQVVILENTESFATEVDNHYQQNYHNQSLTMADVNAIDVKCGATYGAKLIQKLVKTALLQYQKMMEVA